MNTTLFHLNIFLTSLHLHKFFLKSLASLKILLTYIWFTILCWFQGYSKVIQLYTYLYSFFFKILFLCGLSQNTE